MAYPDHLLSRGETIVLHTHPHWKVLVFPLFWFVVIIGGGSFGAAYAHSHTGNYGIWWIALGVVGVIALIWLAVLPFIKWRTEHFIISTKHVFFRSGLIRRREHQIPLGRIQNLETNVTFWGRIFGYGTLTVESAADQPLSFYNVASLPRVQGKLNQLIDDDRSGSAYNGLGERRPGFYGDDRSGAPNTPAYGERYDDSMPPGDDTRTRRIPNPGPDQGYPRS